MVGDRPLTQKRSPRPSLSLLVPEDRVGSRSDDMGWRGTKDTALLGLANTTQFDVFITADKNLPYQQNFQDLTLCVVVLNSMSTRPDRLIPLIIKLIPLLSSLEAGTVTLIDE
jgi:hypothetical protein